jgi:hypothetical protein
VVKKKWFKEHKDIYIFCSERHVHLIMEKNVMRYLKGTLDYGLRYISDQEIRLQGYVDSDWADSVTYRKSTSKCFFSIGSTLISCLSEKQTCMTLISTKVEYVTMWSACSKAMWLWKLNTKMD